MSHSVESSGGAGIPFQDAIAGDQPVGGICGRCGDVEAGQGSKSLSGRVWGSRHAPSRHAKCQCQISIRQHVQTGNSLPRQRHAAEACGGGAERGGQGGAGGPPQRQLTCPGGGLKPTLSQLSNCSRWPASQEQQAAGLGSGALGGRGQQWQLQSSSFASSAHPGCWHPDWQQVISSRPPRWGRHSQYSNSLYITYSAAPTICREVVGVGEQEGGHSVGRRRPADEVACTRQHQQHTAPTCRQRGQSYGSFTKATAALPQVWHSSRGMRQALGWSAGSHNRPARTALLQPWQAGGCWLAWQLSAYNRPAPTVPTALPQPLGLTLNVLAGC